MHDGQIARLPDGNTNQMTPAQKLKIYREKYGITLKKGLSQSFLADPAVLSRVAESLDIRKGECVVEVGAGAGFLTEHLLRAGARVIAVEVDEGMVEVLEGELGENPNLEVIQADILVVDLGRLLDSRGIGKCAVAGNLPYHITTPTVFHLLEARAWVSRMALMVQLEVGDRMSAKPGGKEYGALSLGVSYGCMCERLFTVGPGAFIPPPRVKSAVMRLYPLEPQLTKTQEKVFYFIVKQAFSQRRKMMINAVAEALGGKEKARKVLEIAGISDKERAENIDLQGFMNIAKIVESQKPL